MTPWSDTARPVWGLAKAREKTSCICVGASWPGYCLVGKIPPPPPGGGVEMGGWVSPKIQHFGPPGHPPPPQGCGCAFFGIWVVQGSETCLNFSSIFHIFFILCQTCEPFVAHCCRNQLLAELVVMLNSAFKWWQLFTRQFCSVVPEIFTTANGGFSIKCLYVTVGGGHRPPPPRGGGRVGSVGGWVAEPWPRPKLTPPPPPGSLSNSLIMAANSL